jgi:hypothetical protein
LFASAEQEGERQSQSDKSEFRQKRRQGEDNNRRFAPFSIFNFQFSINYCIFA